MHRKRKRKRKPPPKTSFLLVTRKEPGYINSGCAGITSEETAVPFLARQINCRETALPFPEFGQY